MQVSKFDIIIPPQDIACKPGLQSKLAAGDSNAFGWVYTNYCKRIYKYVLVLTGDETTSEDIVQDVFIKLWCFREKIGRIENFNAYLYRLAQNHTLDKLKGDKNRKQRHKNYFTSVSIFAGNADELIHFKETSLLIKQAIDTLPKNSRIVFELREQGLKRNEIVKWLGKSDHAVKGYTSRMSQHFKERLQ